MEDRRSSHLMAIRGPPNSPPQARGARAGLRELSDAGGDQMARPPVRSSRAVVRGRIAEGSRRAASSVLGSPWVFSGRGR